MAIDVVASLGADVAVGKANFVPTDCQKDEYVASASAAFVVDLQRINFQRVVVVEDRLTRIPSVLEITELVRRQQLQTVTNVPGSDPWSVRLPQ